MSRYIEDDNILLNSNNGYSNDHDSNVTENKPAQVSGITSSVTPFTVL